MMDEQNCIDQTIAGDCEKYRYLVERYQTGLIIHCENILNDREEAEDAAQDAFIKAYKNLAGFSSDKANYSTWLYRIGTNIYIDILRKNKRKVQLKNIESHLEDVLPQHIEQDEIDHIRKLVSELEPPKYVEVIKAYFWEGKSYQELSVIYGTSTGTIGTWISRAKLQLKEKLV